MEYKKTIILLALVVFLLSIAGVSASEIDNTIASENANTIELSIDNDIEDNLQTSEENEALASTDYDEAIAQTDTEVLGADSAKYSDLANEIRQPGNITLTHKSYTYDEGAPEIFITEANKVIDGNGAVIDMAGSTIRAFYISGSGVTIKNLTIKNANYNGNGGAIFFTSSGTVSNCNFTDNSASSDGGAIRMNSGTVSNCNFSNNSASSDGGAIWIYSGTVTNCNFADNKATGDYSYGGAVYFYGAGNVTNCNFVDNKAAGDYSYGGAVYFSSTGTGTVTNCNFTNNTATYYGGAIRFSGTGTVTNCNFTGNNATTGSAIYFYKLVSSDTLTVSDSTFLNNRANAGALDIVKTENNITITFTGQNNLLNAIYSRNNDEVDFTNVTYWGADGITTVSAKLSGSNKAAGQNITVKGVVNGKIIDKINVTDENGEIVLDDAGDYWIIVSHKGDLYYTEIAETLFTNMKLYANVTSLTTNNKTVNITAKSNIFSEVMPGKLLFILPNGENITANYAGNGTWWAEHTFDGAGDYNVNASYIGLDNVTINNSTISIRYDARVDVNNKTLDLFVDDTFTVVATTAPEGLDVSFVPDDSGVYSIDVNGKVTALREGEGSILIKVGGDGIYAENSTIVTVTVSKVPTEITASDVSTVYNTDKYLLVNLKDSAGKALAGVKVTIDLNGAKTYITDGNGQIKVSTKGLAPKAYTAKVTFNGNTNYVKSSKDVKVTVKKATPKLTAKKKTFKSSVKTKKYTIVLKDNTGKAIKKAKVTLKVKGKTYKATTNSKGKATFKIKKLNKKGTFKATVTYKGNNYYNKATKKAIIKVIVTFKTVSKGSKDKATVKEIQQALKNNGYYLTYDGHYLKIDGIYHGCTERSVKEFQKDKHLKVTGKVDEKTAKKLGLI